MTRWYDCYLHQSVLHRYRFPEATATASTDVSAFNLREAVLPTESLAMILVSSTSGAGEGGFGGFL